MLGLSSPQGVRLDSESPPVLALTDGASEDLVSVGGVLDEGQAGVLEHFGAEGPKEVGQLSSLPQSGKHLRVQVLARGLTACWARQTSLTDLAG